ncbi:hypothetical protein QQF64_019812 [Cirrhinus molitorella]|uniref:Uncharacterized protein n=1 Tax=Cirrhinus molitorella TaxID=172907 RepID=A0ABR3LIW1_9TELE
MLCESICTDQSNNEPPFQEKACKILPVSLASPCVYSTRICRLKTNRASPLADGQDTKTEVLRSHDALRVSPGPEREVLSTRPSIERPLQDWRAPTHYKVHSNGYTPLIS